MRLVLALFFLIASLSAHADDFVADNPPVRQASRHLIDGSKIRPSSALGKIDFLKSSREWIVTWPASDRVLISSASQKAYIYVVEYKSTIPVDEANAFLTSGFASAVRVNRPRALNIDGSLLRRIESDSTEIMDRRVGRISYDISFPTTSALFTERVWAEKSKVWQIQMVTFAQSPPLPESHDEMMNAVMASIVLRPGAAAWFDFLRSLSLPESVASEMVSPEPTPGDGQVFTEFHMPSQAECAKEKIPDEKRAPPGLKVSFSTAAIAKCGAGLKEGFSKVVDTTKATLISAGQKIEKHSDENVKANGCVEAKVPPHPTFAEMMAGISEQQHENQCTTAAVTKATLQVAKETATETIKGALAFVNWVRTTKDPFNVIAAMIQTKVPGFMCINADEQLRVYCKFTSEAATTIAAAAATAAATGGTGALLGGATLAEAGSLAISSGARAALAMIEAPYTIPKNVAKAVIATPKAVASVARKVAEAGAKDSGAATKITDAMLQEYGHSVPAPAQSVTPKSGGEMKPSSDEVHKYSVWQYNTDAKPVVLTPEALAKKAEADFQKTKADAFAAPRAATESGSYNLSDVLAKRDTLGTEAGKKYEAATHDISTLAGRESITGTKLTQKIGEGYNGAVYKGADGFVYKFPLSPKGAMSLETEAAIAKDLTANHGIPVLENLVVDPKSRYIKKPLIATENLASEIIKKGALTTEQTKSLESLYNKARAYANKTGIGLDLKSENLYWDAHKKQWALLEAGPRTSYLPYGFTLDTENFDHYKKIWRQAEPPANIEKAVNRELFNQYADINKEYNAAKTKLAERPSNVVENTAHALSDPKASAPVKYRLVSDLPERQRVEVLAARANAENATNVSGPLKSGIQRSGISGAQLDKSLYQATRFSRTANYLDFIKKVSSLAEYGGVMMLDSGKIAEPLEYFAKKAFATVKFRNVNAVIGELKAVKDEERVLVLAPEEAIMLAKNPDFVSAAQSAKKLKIYINDQLGSGITPFNFKNPEAVAKAITETSSPTAMRDAKAELEKLGLGKNVSPLYYDGDASARNVLSAKPPTKSLSLADAVEKIGAPKLDTSKITQKLERYSKDNGKQSEIIKYATTNLHLESLQKTNERIGNLLEQAKSLAKLRGYSEDLYFYVDSKNNSTVLFKKILQESYGIPEDHFYGNFTEQKKILKDRKTPMVLAVDDFIGSGSSMKSFLQSAQALSKFYRQDGSQVMPSFRPFVTFATTEGANLLKRYEPFIDTVLPNNSSGFAQEALAKRAGVAITTQFGENPTSIGFEYMAPDNNMNGLRPILESWTVETGIKSQ